MLSNPYFWRASVLVAMFRIARKSTKLRGVTGALALLVAVVGCASVSVRKIDPEGTASGPDGVRFYRPRPYVSVSPSPHPSQVGRTLAGSIICSST